MLPNINRVWGRSVGLGIYRTKSTKLVIWGVHPVDIRQMFYVMYEKDRRKGLVRNIVREFEENRSR